jgi:hypothetical protein
MVYSPIFAVEYKKFSNKIVLIGVNFNFIPIEIRELLFDKFISEQDFERNSFLKVDYEGIYRELISLGFEYSLVEYELSRVKLVHRINLNILPRFLYSQHPKNIYDPNKLVEIWKAKINNREQRHKEIMLSNLAEFFDINSEISEKFSVLKGHVSRIRRNTKKYNPGGNSSWM